MKEADLLSILRKFPPGRYFQSTLIYSSVIFFEKEPLEAELEACQVLLALQGIGRRGGRIGEGVGGNEGGYESASKYQ